MMSEIKAAGAICFVRDGKNIYYLLLRSAKHAEWGPPKGKAESGESLIETATRELYEEAGVRRVSFTPGFERKIDYSVKTKNGMKSKAVLYYLCELPSDEVTLSHEHSESHMATLDEVETLISHDNLREVFRAAAAFIKSQPQNG
jgi:8-oxo-dGTP pyrophosphatase MutT (NUDIX family)